MKRVLVSCEGQTEESFIKNVLAPHFYGMNIWLIPIIVKLRGGGKGGVVSYGALKRQLVRICRQEATAIVTTMYDLYALPAEFPGYSAELNGYARAHAVEKAFRLDIGEENFRPYISVHEFEAMLFSDVSCFNAYFDFPDLEKGLSAIVRKQPNPELINDGAETAPSKRILDIVPTYDKVAFGTILAQGIGLATIRAKCQHFNEWCLWLEQFAEVAN